MKKLMFVFLVGTVAATAFGAPVETVGFLKWEYYGEIPGTTVEDLINSPKYPDSPDETKYLTSFSTIPQLGGDYASDFGARITGWITPPQSGNYDFFIRSDDSSELWISSDDNPVNLVLQCEETGCCESFLEWDAANQRGQTLSFWDPALLPLVGGQMYYVEAIYKEGGGGDYCEVAWRIEGNPTPAGSLSPIAGGFLTAEAESDPDPPTTVVITEQPESVTEVQNQTATFSVQATSGPSADPPPIAYRWQKNGVDIVGAYSNTYTTGMLALSDNGAQYRCLVSIPGKTETSDVATLTVEADEDPPTVVSANGFGNKIGICFNEVLDETTASDPFNYVVAGGATVDSAELATGEVTVVLTISGLSGDTFTVDISNVEDLAGNPVAAGTQATGSMESGLAAQDIGDPALAGSVYSCASGSYVLSGGGDAFASNDGDQVFFVSEEIMGDFDKRAKISSIIATIPSDNWARGGLMARVSNSDPTSRAVKIIAGNPDGANQATTRNRSESGDPGADPPVGVGYSRVSRNYSGVIDALPNQWLRLQRVGNNFNMYLGSDGENWSLIGERYIIDMDATLQVGMYAAASTAPDEEASTPGSVTTVAFEDYSDVDLGDSTAPTAVSAGTLDKETIGVLFSELMDASTTTLVDNYTLSQGTVVGAVPGVNGDSVHLSVAGLTDNDFTVTVSAVQDISGNTISPDSQVSGSVSPFIGEDVGRFVDVNNRPQETDNPYIVGRYVALSSGDNIEVDILADGANLWTSNYFHYLYMEKTGDFDVMCEVTRQTQSAMGGAYSHGGLMARDGLYFPGQEYTDAGSKVLYEMNTTYNEASQERAALVLFRATEGAAEGVGQIVGTGTQDPNGWIGRFGKLTAGNASGDPLDNTSPNSNRWLRLKREGQVFTHYWSYDGVNWTEYDVRDRADTPMPQTLLVGYAGQGNAFCCDGAAVDGRPGLYVQANIRNLGDWSAAPLEADLDIQRDGSNVVLTWDGNWTLQESDNADGPWTDVAGATSPYSTPASAGIKFYKLK